MLTPAAVTRVAFQRIRASERPALMFTNIDGYDTPLVVGVLGGSPSIYATSLQTEVENIPDVWRNARENPIPPRMVATGPVKENIFKGNDIGLDLLSLCELDENIIEDARAAVYYDRPAWRCRQN